MCHLFKQIQLLIMYKMIEASDKCSPHTLEIDDIRKVIFK